MLVSDVLYLIIFSDSMGGSREVSEEIKIRLRRNYARWKVCDDGCLTAIGYMVSGDGIGLERCALRRW